MKALGLLLPLLLAVPGFAQCQTGYCQNTATYHAAPTYNTYRAPAYNYAPPDDYYGRYFPYHVPNYPVTPPVDYSTTKTVTLTHTVGAINSAPATAAAPHAPVCDTSELKAQVKALQDRLNALTAPVPSSQALPPAYAPRSPVAPQELLPAPQKQPGQKVSFLGVMNLRCAKCHDATTAESKGDGLVITKEGQLFDMTRDKAARIVASLIDQPDGTPAIMPKKSPPLPDEELWATMTWYSQFVRTASK